MAFLKLGRRKAMAISVANAAALLARENERIGQARLALGAVAPTAVRCPAAERLLRGRRPDETLFAAAADRVLETICPISDVRASAAYRRLVAVTLARRALIQAWGGTQGR
jgi:CO/xanthine dehydrogenase FAD-binding subunit